MTDPFDDWKPYRALLDEILYRDPSGLIRQLEVRNGSTRMMEIITFADGSRLAISAQVPLPPMEAMTPKTVTFLKLNGERGERLDDGSSEALELARQSIAVRFMEKISRTLDEMPEREKITCPECCGGKYCIHCYGKGCPHCQGTGVCTDCDGHGLIAKENEGS
jgi:excinuclease UvrABC ATPase subunit